MKTTGKITRPTRILSLSIAIILLVSLMATPAAASACVEGAPDPVVLTQGLVITERSEYGLGREFVHVVIDGGLIVTMDVAAWRVLADHDPDHPGYLLNYDSVFNLWQVQRAAEWVDRNLYLASDGSLGYSLTDPHDPEFRHTHLTTVLTDQQIPLAGMLGLVTGETVEVAPVSTVALTVYRADGTTQPLAIEIAQILAPVETSR